MPPFPTGSRLDSSRRVRPCVPCGRLPSRIDEPCPIPAQCPYHLIFETSPPPGSEALRTHDDIPRPFVIAPADLQWADGDGQVRQAFQRGDEVSFELILIGRAQ